MEKLKQLVDALNACEDCIAADTKIMVTVEKATETTPAVKYFIKKRPVRNEDGIEEMEFVARKQA